MKKLLIMVVLSIIFINATPLNVFAEIDTQENTSQNNSQDATDSATIKDDKNTAENEENFSKSNINSPISSSATVQKTVTKEVREGNYYFYTTDTNEIVYALEKSGTKIIMYFEYYDGTIYGQEHGLHIKYKYFVNDSGQITKATEHEDITRQTTKYFEYYSGARFIPENIGNNHTNHLRYVFEVNANNEIKTAYAVKDNSTQILEYYEYYSGTKYGNNNDGKSHGFHISYTFYLDDNSNVKYATQRKDGTEIITSYYEYHQGTNYDVNTKSHGTHIKYEFVLNSDSTIKYAVEYMDISRKIINYYEYHSGTKYDTTNKTHGTHIKYMFILNSDLTINHAIAYTDISKKITNYYEYYSGTKYDIYNKSHGNHIKYEFFTNDWDTTLKYAFEYKDGTRTVVRKYYYYSWTYYGQDHGKRIERIEEVSSSSFIWPTSSRDISTNYMPNGEATIDENCNAPWCYIWVNGGNHYGIDITQWEGAEIYASASGIVIKSEYDSSKGNYVIIKHSNDIYTGYYHMNNRNVNIGQNVSQGQVIGWMGNTGLSFGTHLHFQMGKWGYSNNDSVDPANYLPGIKYVWGYGRTLQTTIIKSDL